MQSPLITMCTAIAQKNTVLKKNCNGNQNLKCCTYSEYKKTKQKRERTKARERAKDKSDSCRF
eukprot:2434569-Amphidinium_carterae.1